MGRNLFKDDLMDPSHILNSTFWCLQHWAKQEADGISDIRENVNRHLRARERNIFVVELRLPGE
jgi:hypothetical protein